MDWALISKGAAFADYRFSFRPPKSGLLLTALQGARWMHTRGGQAVGVTRYMMIKVVANCLFCTTVFEKL